MEDFVVLNNGVRMPRVGLGVYAIPVNQTKDAVLTALSLGYRHIDTAQLYKNEAEVGEAVRASGIPRKEIFVTTKLWGARDYEGREAIDCPLSEGARDRCDRPASDPLAGGR